MEEIVAQVLMVACNAAKNAHKNCGGCSTWHLASRCERLLYHHYFATIYTAIAEASPEDPLRWN